MRSSCYYYYFYLKLNTTGLDYVHRDLGIIHTDLKPENVMFTKPLEHIFMGTPLQYSARRKDQRNSRSDHIQQDVTISQMENGSAHGQKDDGYCGDQKWRDSWCAFEADWSQYVVDNGRIHCKIVDFGNACWTHKHFTDDIQTRQYRSPEIILGEEYSTPVDIWSVACMTFEIATGEHLFDPRTGSQYSRDEDHLALFMELLGRIPKKMTTRGKLARKFFNKSAELRNIRNLQFWSLEDVLQEKYKYSKDLAIEFANFLLPMLNYVSYRRATAAQMIRSSWITSTLHLLK